MGLSKYKLGELIELVEETNSEELYGPEDVRGISNLKEMMTTKADLNGRDLSKFQIVRPGTFVFNHRTSRNGSKFSITYNYDSKPHIFTEDYVVFRINEDGKNIILKEWLYMYFCRAEFDRFVITNSWGSSTEFYNWQDLCNLDITLPPIEQQRKYVDVYLALQNNLAVYQSKVEELKLVCDGYIEELRREMPCEKISPFIRPCDERNTDLRIKLAQGITNEKEFASPKQVAEAETSAKIVRKGQFAYNRATTRNGEKISIAYRTEEDCVVSSAYQIFEISSKDKLYPEYLMMWYKRSEFDRYARYMSKGSAHEFFEYEDMEEVQIPIPSLDKQKAIASIYKIYRERKAIAIQLKEQLNNLCPILIKGSLETCD